VPAVRSQAGSPPPLRLAIFGAAMKNKAIFSDDPAAGEKLAEKIDRLQKRQDLTRSANRLVRKGDREGVADLGFSETQIEKLFTPDVYGSIGFADYATRNNGAEIRRLKKRLETLEAHANDETQEYQICDIKVVDSVEANRLQIFFGERVPAEVYKELKSHGFCWTPSIGAFQAYRGNSANYWAKTIIENHYSQVQEVNTQ